MSENSILINVPGTPRSQPRGRMAGDKAKCCGGLLNVRIVSVIDPKAKRWIAAVKAATSSAFRELGGAPVVREIMGGAGEPLRLGVFFRIPTKDAKRWGKLHAQDGGSDTDNLVKLIKDAMWTCGIPNALQGGDGRVCVEYAVKVWCKPADAGASIRIERIPEAMNFADAWANPRD